MQLSLQQFNNITPKIAENVYIDQSSMVIGDVTIGSDSSVWPMVVIRGDMHSIRIGKKTSIQDGSVLHITHASKYVENGYSLTIGNEVTVGHKVCLHGCKIGDQCLIGIGSIILDGAILEDRVMLAAGSLVPPNKHLKSGFLYKGNPAKLCRELTEKEIDFLAYSAFNYVKLKNQYLKNILANRLSDKL